MRITGGEFRGKKLLSPEGLETRPTSDRARQAIFNIVNHAGWRTRDLLDNALVLDVFAGTGALGLEALSQGGKEAVFIEQSPAALKVLRENIAGIRADNRTKVIKSNALNLTARPHDVAPRTLVFLDPPYGKDMGAAALQELAQKGWLEKGAVCVLEMAKKQPEKIPAGFILLDTRHYGVAEVAFLQFAP